MLGGDTFGACQFALNASGTREAAMLVPPQHRIRLLP
jgi:hypothetical protein